MPLAAFLELPAKAPPNAPLPRPKHRILMRSAHLLEHRTRPQHTFQQGIVVEHKHRPRMLPQRLFEMTDHRRQSGFWKRIEQVEHGRLLREMKLAGVAARAWNRGENSRARPRIFRS